MSCRLQSCEASIVLTGEGRQMSTLPYLRHTTTACCIHSRRNAVFSVLSEVGMPVVRQTRNSHVQVGLPVCVRQSEYSPRGSKWDSVMRSCHQNGPTMFPRDVSASPGLTSVPRGSYQLMLLFKRVIWSDSVVDLSIKSVLKVSSSLVPSSFHYPPCLSLFKSSTSFWGLSLSGLSRK